MDAQPNNPITLGDVIAQAIAESSHFRITFAEFMDLALYHPNYGYYASQACQIGAAGDFFTSPHLGSDFGELLAEQFFQMWALLDYPTPFTLVEMGAGQGLLAKDILDYVDKTYPNFGAALEYIIIERATALIAEQKQQLAAWSRKTIRWCSLEELPPEAITGCIFSNELVDALPVHLVIAEGRQLQEVYVTTYKSEADTQFVEVIDAPSTPQLVEYFQAVGVDLLTAAYPDHYRTEVNLAALDWITTLSSKLERGYILTIDYGYPSDRYYHPQRSEGTLQCYYRHSHHSNPYIYVGEQDITAHVDFTALQRRGERCGLRTLGLTKQGLFLMALGLGDRLAMISQSTAQSSPEVLDQLRYRDALQQLINPMGLGNFGVLIQAKAVEDNIPLKGLWQGL